MTPFLKKVAETFIEKAGRLDRTCFVFPNRRSGAFFRKYLRECSVNPMIFPEVQTISDFIGSHSGLIDAGRIEQLFALYDSYLKVAGHVDFDRFLYWGDMILGDFNDVDRYMVDARELFVNIENLKSINADFLTESQREVIKNFFGEYRVGGTENLWIGDHIDRKRQSIANKRSLRVRCQQTAARFAETFSTTLVLFIQRDHLHFAC